jgi:uncharacterized protein (DUF58 family)
MNARKVNLDAITPNNDANALTVEAHDAALPAIMMDARRAASSIVIGEHGRRSAGAGDAFWQHREWTNGESIRQIDWRRSARSEKLFVRERERQVPAILQVWCDNRANMAWRGDSNTPTKAQRGLVLGLALSIATRAGGERVCALGPGSPLSNEVAFAHLLTNAGQSVPNDFQAGQVLMISDGLEQPDVWAHRAKQVLSARAHLIVVLIADRYEQDFPFQGRVAFSASDSDHPLVVGRAQGARDGYVLAYRRHLAAVEQAIIGSSGQVFRHVTSDPAVPILLTISAVLDGAAPIARLA